MMRRIMSWAVLASAAACAAFAMHPRAEAASAPHLYVIEYKPGSAWKPGIPMNKQALGPHASYWKRLAAEGRALAAGPYLDIDGGMAIVMADSIDDARAIVASDPAVTIKVFIAELHEWSPRIRGAGELPRPQ